MASHLVFSYGTLKSGEPNCEVMIKPETGVAKFVGKGETVKRYPLIVASMYNIPFLLRIEGKGENVEGEIWEVDDDKLLALDDLESHPDFYCREETEISMTHNHEVSQLDSPEIKKCWVYFLPRFKPEMVDLPYYKSYTSNSKDHPPYVERYKRKGTIQDFILPDKQQ